MNKNLEKSSQNLNKNLKKNLKKNAKKDEAKLEFHLHSKPLEKLHSYQNLNTNSSKISNVNFKENLNKNNKNQGTNLSNQAQILNAPNLNSVQISQAKQNILDFTKAEFEAKFDKKFRVKQIFEWIYQKYADDFSQMSSLPKNLREELAQIYHFSPLKCVIFCFQPFKVSFLTAILLKEWNYRVLQRILAKKNLRKFTRLIRLR